jgi:hypothetical protein
LTRCSGGDGTDSGGRGQSVSGWFILSIVAQMLSSETEIVPASSIPLRAPECLRLNENARAPTHADDYPAAFDRVNVRRNADFARSAGAAAPCTGRRALHRWTGLTRYTSWKPGASAAWPTDVDRCGDIATSGLGRPPESGGLVSSDAAAARSCDAATERGHPDYGVAVNAPRCVSINRPSRIVRTRSTRHLLRFLPVPICRPRTGWQGRAADPSARSRRCGS